MSQNEFYTAVVDGILDYFPEDYQDAKVLIAEQTKSGDVQVHGLSITKKENTISPVLNLDSFYDSYLRGEDMNHIMRTIAATYVQTIRKQPDIDIPDFSKEGLEKNVLIRAIDRNANENFLKERPYIDLGCGYVGTMYVPMEVNENRAMVQLTYGNLDSVGIDPDALFEKAVENTEKMQPAVFANMEEILFAPDPEPNLLKENPHADPESQLLVLTNRLSYHGATALFYPDTREEIGDILGQNFYVLPSSIHEVLIIPEKNAIAGPEQMVQMVKEINETQVAPEDRFGNRVLFYDRDTKELQIAADLDRKPPAKGKEL